jgi:alkyl sulfatase BDS1-like metallo-beta-lactamase superfamily hydrolase
VVVDAAMSPARAAPIREALLEASPGPVLALIYTHSHIDHVGGASVWAEQGTQIWATERFAGHFFKQYDRFLRAETARAARQFGRDVDPAELPCSALGRTVDIDAALEVGALMPTNTFTGSQRLEFGGTVMELVEAHGETDDQLFAWLPASRTLLPGDNWYRAFPNLYTIRGSRPRPVDAWIASLDAMRRLEPAVLVPSHTGPLVGADAIAEELRAYRDAIQWVRDSVVQGANAGHSLPRIVRDSALPPHLAGRPSLAELYGRVDWSARALYGNELGWFDGKASGLLPLDSAARSELLVGAMGGAAKVRALAQDAEPAAALELLALLEQHPDTAPGSLDAALARSYEALAASTGNSNGRAYLLQSAAERRGAARSPGQARPGPGFVGQLPLAQLMGTLGTRLMRDVAADVHEAVVFDFGPDGRWTITQRRGVAEVVAGDPLPGTPEPVATVQVPAATWRRLSIQLTNPAAAISSGDLQIDHPLAFARFMKRFDRALIAAPDELP